MSFALVDPADQVVQVVATAPEKFLIGGDFHWEEDAADLVGEHFFFWNPGDGTFAQAIPPGPPSDPPAPPQITGADVFAKLKELAVLTQAQVDTFPQAWKDQINAKQP